jgi:hypothetical protein
MPNERVSDLDLERFLTDDLDDADRARVAAAVTRDSDLAAHVAERRAEQQAFALLHPRAPQPATKTMAMAMSTTSMSTLLAALQQALAPLTAAAAVLAVFVVVGGDEGNVSVRGAGLVARMTVRRGDGDEAVVFSYDRQPLRADDAVRIEVELARAQRCSVFDVDARGVADVVYDNVAVAKGKQVLPDALVLDDSEGAEDLVVVCGDDVAVGSDVVDIAHVAQRFRDASMATLSFTKEPSSK